MDYLPIFLKMHGRRAVIVGGGVIASRKAALVAKSGAHITIVSPAICDALRLEIENGQYDWVDREFEPDDLATAHLVIAATDATAVNHQVYEAAARLRIPANIADKTELCSFILPAIVDRSPAIIAVSTGGRSPVLARHVKALLERALPAGLGRLAEFCGRVRQRVARRIADTGMRRRFWEDVLDSDVPELVYGGRAGEAAKRLSARLREGGPCAQRGAVYLIGAGPGDPELLTLKAQRLLQRADVVLYDRLVPVGVLEMCRREAEMVYVGKRHGDHPLPQEQISALLVRYAGAGKRVARLKGGDPFIFGRGGEELAALAAARIDFQVVPGISAANGAASYAGIPLTHRDHAQGVSFWTGHTREGALEMDWRALCQSRQTQVFYMGAASAPQISRRLIEHGMAPATPVAVVQAATTRRQTVLRTSLFRLRAVREQLDRSLPTLIIVGSVVNLRSDLQWFRGTDDPTVAVFPPHLSSANAGTNHGAV